MERRRHNPKRTHPGIFIIVHTFLGLEKYVIGGAMIRMDVKSIGILGKFFAKNVVSRQEVNMTIVIRMQKNIDQGNIIIGKSRLNWLRRRYW